MAKTPVSFNSKTYDPVFLSCWIRQQLLGLNPFILDKSGEYTVVLFPKIRAFNHRAHQLSLCKRPGTIVYLPASSELIIRVSRWEHAVA